MNEKTTTSEAARRAECLRYAESVTYGAARRERIEHFIPGQVIYNLGEYPAPFKIRPTEYDYELIKSLAERGVGLIQIHEEWNDANPNVTVELSYAGSYADAANKISVQMSHNSNLDITSVGDMLGGPGAHLVIIALDDEFHLLHTPFIMV